MMTSNYLTRYFTFGEVTSLPMLLFFVLSRITKKWIKSFGYSLTLKTKIEKVPKDAIIPLTSSYNLISLRYKKQFTYKLSIRLAHFPIFEHNLLSQENNIIGFKNIYTTTMEVHPY